MCESERAKLQAYKEEVKRDGEKLLKTEFPATILRLNAILETPQFTRKTFEDLKSGGDHLDSAMVMAASPGTKRPRSDAPECTVRTNKYLIQLIETVKPYMIKLVEDSTIVKMWVAFMIPKIEDGNNFGVEIQEEVLMLFQDVECHAAKFYERISGYFTSRAKLVKKIFKYPQIEDYKRSVWELDEREYLGFCMIMKMIRNSYCQLHDLFMKNIDKIKVPRSNHSNELFY